MRNASDPAEPERDVLMTESSYPTAQMYTPAGFVHGTVGGYGHGHEGDSDDGDGHGAGRWNYYADGVGAGQDWLVGPHSEITALCPDAATDLPPTGTRSTHTCTTRPATGYSLCSWFSTYEYGSCHCLVCKAVSSPRVTRCHNWARGCPGGATDFGPAPIGNAAHGSPVFHLG